MRILGLDYGSKTVGVAISDPLGITAQGVETIWRKQENHLRQTLARIEELVSEYHVEKIVLGYPKNMNNTIGERAQKSLEFKEMLERRTGLEVIMWDERLTTVEANRTLMEASVRRENRKQYLDQLAAFLFCRDIWIPCPVRRLIRWRKLNLQLEDGTEAVVYVEEQTGSEELHIFWYLILRMMRRQPIFLKTCQRMTVRKPAMKWSRTRMRCRLFLKYLNKC